MPQKRRFVNGSWIVKLCAIFAMGCSYADEYVNFEHFLGCPFSKAVVEVGALPIYIDFSKSQIEESFAEFTRGKNFDEMEQLFKIWNPDFFASDYAAPWKGAAKTRQARSAGSTRPRSTSSTTTRAAR